MSQDEIYSRRSIRKFKPDEVSLNLIEKIVDAGRVAPSAKNRQPWKCIVFGGEQKKEFLNCMEKGIAREEHEEAMLPDSKYGIPDAKNTLRIMREAPIILVILNAYGDNIFEQQNACEGVSEICNTLSIGAFIENMILKAEELGIGTLWIANTCFAYNELVGYLNTTNQLVSAVAIGYPDEHPSERPRKKLEDIIEYRL